MQLSEWSPGTVTGMQQVALFGFPPPGHAYWTEATVAGTEQRYPGLDMTPWRQALRGEA
jgi:hypothetical protein